MFNPLDNSTNQELFEKHPCIPKKSIGTVHASYINYHLSYLKSEVSITLRCWLCSTHYTVVRINNCYKNTSAIEVATMKIRMIFVTKGSHHMLPPNRHFSLSAKMNGTQRRPLVRKSMKNSLYILRYAKRHLLG